MTPRRGLIAHGEVYNVRERMSEENGIPGEWDDYPDWYEYEMFLIEPNGDIVSEWDSLTETYNGVQRLTEAEARKSVKEIVDDVKAGKASHWFTNIRETAKSTKPKSRKSTRRKSASVGTSLGGMR